MCSKNALFENISLEGKHDPIERFMQALDECSADGRFRTLLIRHLSENWRQVFRNVDSLEDALTSAQPGKSDAEKCTAFLLAKPIVTELRSDLGLYVFNRWCPPRAEALFAFANDVARECFHRSHYTLYCAGLGKALGNPPYHMFVSALYGKDYCFSKAFFDDGALASLEPQKRTDFLWQVFESMAQQVCSAPSNADTLISAALLAVHIGPPAHSVCEFRRGIEFLKAWVQYDAEAGRICVNSRPLLSTVDNHWYWDLQGHLNSAKSAHTLPVEVCEAAESWLRKTSRELRTLYYRYTDLSSATEAEKALWAEGLEEHFDSYFLDFPDLATVSLDEKRARESEYLVELCSQLKSLQLETWIQWSIDADIQSALESDTGSRTPSLKRGSKWWGTAYSDIYAARFQEALCHLEMESRLRVLSCRLDSDCLNTEASYRASLDWWDGILRDLVKYGDFPKKLIPQWAVATKYRLSQELRTSFIDQSIGILRGELSRDEGSEYSKQLAVLLSELDDSLPSKALRHRLMLMRSSLVPFRDESILPFKSNSSDKDAVEWDCPMSELAQRRAVHQDKTRRGIPWEEWDQVQVETLTAFSLELAEFCLSRLRLRKGEKAPKDCKYEASQVTESSPIWRRGYLKALTELGFDLNGKAHKTVNFTKQWDPDEGVRASASECYRAVRRDSKSTRSFVDLKRGIIAAEWWLLMCQRLELNLDVNNDEALKTRRRLLRNP